MGRYVQRTRGRLRTGRAPIHSFRCEEMLFTGVPVATFGLDEHVGGGEVRVRGEEGEGVAQPDDVEVALQHLLHGCGVCVTRASSRPGRARIWGGLRGGNHERLVKAGRSVSEAGAASRSTE